MKRQFAAIPLLAALAVPAFAGPCVALDYQEMKDMSVNELVAEACKAQQIGDAGFQQVMTNLDTKRGAPPYPNAEAEVLQCAGQRDRIMRILKTKNVTENLPELCKQQGQGKVITGQ
jgi:hypothetical protein